MGSQPRTVLVALIVIGSAIPILFGCAGRAEARPVEVVLEAIPERQPGVEVEVLAAQRAGRGDVALVFLLGRDGRVEKRAGFQSIRAPDLVEAPRAVKYRLPGQPIVTEDLRGDVGPLAEAEAGAVMKSIWDSIVAATTPEIFDAPEEFIAWGKRPWRCVQPPVRLRVDPNWLASTEESLFDGTWVMMASAPPPDSERVVLNVVGWRYSIRRSKPIELLLSRGFLPEAQLTVPLHDPKSGELRDALHAHGSDDVLPDVAVPTPHTVYGTPWRAISGTLRIEVDRSWLSAHLVTYYYDIDRATERGRPESDRWSIIHSGEHP